VGQCVPAITLLAMRGATTEDTGVGGFLRMAVLHACSQPYGSANPEGTQPVKGCGREVGPEAAQ